MNKKRGWGSVPAAGLFIAFLLTTAGMAGPLEMRPMEKPKSLKVLCGEIFGQVLSFVSLFCRPAHSPSPDLLCLSDIASGVVIDMKYATADNFTHEILYESDKAYLRREVAEALALAETVAEKRGFKLKIWDAYRPLSVQKKMWKIMPDSRYVADPAKGSVHNRGGAVDLTLVDQGGHDLDMGCAFDDFSKKASPLYQGFPENIQTNRKQLKEIMEQCGFEQLSTEWWHFDFKGSRKFPVLDLPIR